MINKAKWIGRAINEIASFEGNPLDNIKDIKYSINEVRESLLLRKVFTVKKAVKNVSVQICGLGLYTLRINGKKSDERVLTPLQTNYRDHVYYDEADITALIKPGKNVMLIELGTGQYAAPKKRWDWRMCWYGNVRAIASVKIEYIDGETEYVLTDESFKMHNGAVVESCIYDGEKFDARRVIDGVNETDFDDCDWANAVVVESPSKKLEKCNAAPIKVCNTYLPCDVKILKDSILYDFGENRSGWVKIAVSGNSGDSVTINFCERLTPEGMPDYETNRGADAVDIYVLGGKGVEEYAPQFTYHGFRYAVISVSSPSVILHSVVQENIHSAVEVTGTFESDNKDLNKIHRACTLTQTNGFMGFPIDCPQRDERMGWLGDAHVTAEAGVYNFNLCEFYRKWLTDIRTDCDVTGEVPHIAPWPQRKEPSPVDWSSGYLIVALTAYKMYGDKSIIEENYESFKRYMDYLYSISDDYILPQGRYGDWSSSLEGFTRGEPFYDNTMFFYYTLLITKECAQIMNNVDDVKLYDEKLAYMRNRCIDLYYDSDEKSFGDGTQFSNGFALLLGLVPDEDIEAVFNTLLSSIEKSDGHIIGGIFGVQYVMEVLRHFDRGDVAVAAMLKNAYPSWLDMLSRSTTITENWSGEGYASQDHCMLGSVDAQLYKTLGGLDIDMSRAVQINIRPYVTDVCEYVKVTEKTQYGVILSQWHNYSDRIEYMVSIPEKLTAEFEVSKLNIGKDMTLNGKSVSGKIVLENGYNSIIVKK